MKDDKKVPQLRFPEFTDAWKQRKFGEFVERKSDSALSSTSIPSVEYENVESETGILKKDIYVKTEFKKGVLFSDKDVLYGKLRPYLHNWLAPSFTGVAVGDWWVLSPKNCSKDFLYRLLQTLTFDEIANQTSGTKMPRADWNLVSSTAFYIPSSIEEQAKIGSLFNRIDSTITLQQRKLNSLQKLKKGLLQKMFPKKGENIPEIRFPEFSDAWKQRKFGDFAKVSMCKRIFKEETTQTGDVPFFKIGTFGGIPDAFISRYKFESYKAKYPYPKKGDILISASGSIGRIVEYSGKDEYFQDSNIIWLDHDESVLNSFLKHVYSIIKWNGIEGTTIKRLYNDNVLTTKILTPSLEEQSKIGAFFTQLDNTITLQQRKLNSLQKLKKGLLQKMFPKKGENITEIRFPEFSGRLETA